MQVNETNENKEFTPLIVAFCCNWCSYAGADLAGSSRLNYPANVKIIRVPCSCRVNPMFILRAFEKGADGVIMCGCHPGDCHYTTGNYYARRRMTLLFSMLVAQGFFQQLISGQNAAPFKKRKIYKQISYLRCVYIGSAISIMPILMKLKRYIWGFYPFLYRQYHIIVKHTHLSRRNV